MILGREEGKDGERETWINLLPPVPAPTWDRTHNLGVYPDGGWNLQPFGVQERRPNKRATGAMLICYL